MKILASILSGFVLTLAIFAGGVVSAVALLHADPVPVRKLDMGSSGLWTAKAVRIDKASQKFERPAAVARAHSSTASAREEAVSPESAVKTDQEIEIDTTTTASLEVGGSKTQQQQTEHASLTADHVEWCSEHYRSYRPETNSYTPYSGGQRECVSPFSESSPSREPAAAEATVTYVEESANPQIVGYAEQKQMGRYYLSPEHIQSCFARYRSYRPEDNTYQPYGGGPRRQCR